MADRDTFTPDQAGREGGDDASGDGLSAAVVPILAAEFRCVRCFLVCHRSRRAAKSRCA
jgi:hypothetical protein